MSLLSSTSLLQEDSEPSVDVSQMTADELTQYALDNWVSEPSEDTSNHPNEEHNVQPSSEIASNTDINNDNDNDDDIVQVTITESQPESQTSNSNADLEILIDPVLQEDDLKGTKLEKYVSKNRTYTSNVKVDIVGDLPNEMALMILSYLDPNSLLKCGTLSKRWKKLCDTKFLWWKQYNLRVWDADSQPKKMLRKDKKLDWKTKYLDLVRLPEVKNQIVRMEVEFVNTGPTKHEMREHYKSIRSNPKGKKPKRGDKRGALGSEQFDDFF
eukprot:TRINITY_DN818_c0_g1_i2.p1 TRINITY_DN818_c0_g1~~TRINITY_DN818_c0_g1_i2.p1  ORF type:complete len:278 (-),score=55.24 TRINITY_DN818_c0_g1_i2:107-916(-)